MTLHDVLWHSFRHFYHLDHSNAAMHCAPVRYSPITFRLAEEIRNERVRLHEEKPSAVVFPEVYSVLLDLGEYPEDTGR